MFAFVIKSKLEQGVYYWGKGRHLGKLEVPHNSRLNKLTVVAPCNNSKGNKRLEAFL